MKTTVLQMDGYCHPTRPSHSGAYGQADVRLTSATSKTGDNSAAGSGVEIHFSIPA
ncbi:MAG: hypothetical protein Q7T21_01125 [Gallionella sp.]|nr:hypothetical protein [Gallionella sp.]